ncbi:MAG: hypothetical protein WAN93_06535 [Solirubrobacteraceae bacterium]
MSVSTEVQRTLVKSPPELWTELSNPEALARHLAELGEVRITAVEPETKVEWEAEGASGIVHLKQSGWGTKVTLSVTRAAPTGEEAPPEPEAVTETGPAAVETGAGPVELGAETAADHAETEPIAVFEAEPETAVKATPAEPVAVIKPEPETAAEATSAEPVTVIEPLPEPGPLAVVEAETAAELEPRVGFFARLFRRRKTRPHEAIKAQPEPEIVAELGPEPEPEPEPEIEIVALATPEPIYPARPAESELGAAEPSEDLAAELASVEAQMTQETTELLTGVLDRLGAAHHRPFSRG